MRDDVQDYGKCKDLKRNSGNMFGAGSMIDIIGSDHVQKAVASLVQLMGPKMKKTGVAMVDNMIATFAKKKAGSADPLPVLQAVDRIKRAITKGGKCAATYGPHHHDREVANVVCDCSKTVKPTTTAPPPAAPVAPVAPVTPVGGDVAKKPAGQAAGAGSGSGTAAAVTATTATTASTAKPQLVVAATAAATEQHSVLVPDLPYTKPAIPPLVRPIKTAAAAKKVAAQKAEAKKGAAVVTKTAEEATVAANVDDPDTEVERAVLSERKWRAGGGGVNAATAEERDDDPEGGDQTTGEKVIGVLPSIAASEMVDNGTGLDSVVGEAPGTKEGAKGTGVGVGETREVWERTKRTVAGGGCCKHSTTRAYIAVASLVVAIRAACFVLSFPSLSVNRPLLTRFGYFLRCPTNPPPIPNCLAVTIKKQIMEDLLGVASGSGSGAAQKTHLKTDKDLKDEKSLLDDIKKGSDPYAKEKVDALATEQGLSVKVDSVHSSTGGAGSSANGGVGSARAGGAGRKAMCDPATIRKLRDQYGENVMEGGAHWKWVLKEHGC